MMVEKRSKLVNNAKLLMRIIRAMKETLLQNLYWKWVLFMFYFLLFTSGSEWSFAFSHRWCSLHKSYVVIFCVLSESLYRILYSFQAKLPFPVCSSTLVRFPKPWVTAKFFFFFKKKHKCILLKLDTGCHCVFLLIQTLSCQTVSEEVWNIAGLAENMY